MSKRRSDYFGEKDEIIKVRKIKDELKDNSRLWRIKDIEKIPERVDFSHEELMNFLRGLPKTGVKKVRYKTIRLSEVNKDKNLSVLKCTIPLNFGAITTTLILTYYKDKNKWMLQKKDDMVVYDINKKMPKDESWSTSEDGFWCNEDWEFALEISDTMLTIRSKQEPGKVLAELDFN